MIKKPLIFLGVIIVLLLGIVATTEHLKRSDDRTLTINGRAEADEIILSPRIPGRLKDVFIRDGMEVRKGERVATLFDREIRAGRDEIKNRLDAFKARIKAEKENLGYLKKKVHEDISVAQRTLIISRARKKQAEAKRDREELRYRRYETLLRRGVIPRDRFDSVTLSYNLALEEFQIATEEVKRAETILAKTRLSRLLVRAKEHGIEGMMASLDALGKSLARMEIQLSYTEVTVPQDGVVLRKVSEPGEFLNAGGVIGVMIDPDTLHIKTYLPEPYLGKVSLGTQVDVITDTYPERPIRGLICYISDEAEFTPKEVQSKVERVKEVFAMKVCFGEDNGEAYKILKKGMPVDVVIKTADTQNPGK